MRKSSVVTMILGGLIGVGCAGSEGEWEPGKADGAFEVFEAGPAPMGATAITLERKLPAYRVVSYGGTQLTIGLRGQGGSDPYLVVEGPLNDNGDGERAGTGRVVAESDGGGSGDDAKIDITLAEPGVYRILTGTRPSIAERRPPTGEVVLDVACAAGCVRPSLDQKEFLKTLRAAVGGDDALRQMVEAKIDSIVPDPAMGGALKAQVGAILADPELRGIERFPTISLSDVAVARPLLGALDAAPPKQDEKIEGDLESLLGGCSPDRTGPKPTQAPGVGNGHFADVSLSPCQAAHGSTLAQVLTSLATGNGSKVTYDGQTITDPRALFNALLASGHSIEVRNERTYANFISLTLGERDVIWPVWLDTGLRLSSGENLTIPMGHSHHAWRIRGPVVDTRVMFYLGIAGAGFFAQDHIRPAWTGEKVATTLTASGDDANAEAVLAAVDAAALYLRRNRTERTTVAAGLPADGYGLVGVCNDSNAAVEHLTRGTITTFPLLRAAHLDDETPVGDGLDETLRVLPNDADGLPNPADALRRAVAMQPHAAGSSNLWDSVLAAQIEVARRDIGE